ncbi:MAG: galactokinase [Lachnospiraceae bacterium]|nr:galactokinase [Candidatus Colinaster equi]
MKERLLSWFSEIFGDTNNTEVYFAPGRVNLIGEHTDYNGGHVFPCALSVGIYAAASKREDDLLCMYSANYPDAGIAKVPLSLLAPKRTLDWCGYVEGVFHTFRKNGYSIDCGMNILIYGDIPEGAGLSSSAALEVVTGVLIRDFYGIDISNTDIAILGKEAENNYVGTSCGIMDQFASAMGKKDNAIFLDTNTLDYEYAPIKLSDASIVIVNSKVKHSLVSSQYNIRRKECESALECIRAGYDIDALCELNVDEYEQYSELILDDVCRRRAKHAIYENERTIRAKEALNNNDICLFGRLMNESHDSLRDDYEVSCEEIDVLVNLSRELPAVFGSRITGGGFGGCTVNIVANDGIGSFKEYISNGYFKATGIEPEIYVVTPGCGPYKL